MNSVAQIETALQELFGEQARQLARETGCVKRTRKFDGASLLQTLVFGWMQEEEATLEMLTQVAQYAGVQVSDTAVDKRFTSALAECLYRLLQRISQYQVQAEQPLAHTLLRRFRAVIVEDSSQVSLPIDVLHIWRGSGNEQEKAAVKVHVRYDLLSGQLFGPLLTDGRTPDTKSPFKAELLPKGSVYLADSGYWDLTWLRAQQQAGRYWLMRLKAGTVLLNRKGHRVHLKGLLPQQVGQWVCYGLRLGVQAQIPVRVMIVRVPREVAEQRRSDLQKEAKRKGQPLSQQQMDLADWTILVTTVPARLLSVPEAFVLLRLRWQIEILFRRWKDGWHIDEWRSHKPMRILCELYAKLIAAVIAHWLTVVGSWHDLMRSLDKARQCVSREALRLVQALQGQETFASAIAVMTRAMQSGCQLTKRRAHPNSAQLLCEGLDWPVTALCWC
jgi:hypothetical protein